MKRSFESLATWIPTDYRERIIFEGADETRIVVAALAQREAVLPRGSTDQQLHETARETLLTSLDDQLGVGSAEADVETDLAGEELVTLAIGALEAVVERADIPRLHAAATFMLTDYHESIAAGDSVMNG